MTVIDLPSTATRENVIVGDEAWTEVDPRYAVLSNTSSAAGSAEEDRLIEQVAEKRCEVSGGGESVAVEEVQFAGGVGVEVVAAHLVVARFLPRSLDFRARLAYR